MTAFYRQKAWSQALCHVNIILVLTGNNTIFPSRAEHVLQLLLVSFCVAALAFYYPVWLRGLLHKTQVGVAIGLYAFIKLKENPVSIPWLYQNTKDN